MQILQFPVKAFPDLTVAHRVPDTIANAIVAQLRAVVDPQEIAAAALGLTLSRYALLKSRGMLS